MTKDNSKVNPIDLLSCKEVFEKFGERRLFSRSEYFAHSGEVMEYAGWIVSGGFKYSLTPSVGNNRVIGFSLDDSILLDYESVMHLAKMRTDIIALEDSEVIVHVIHKKKLSMKAEKKGLTYLKQITDKLKKNTPTHQGVLCNYNCGSARNNADINGKD